VDEALAKTFLPFLDSVYAPLFPTLPGEEHAFADWNTAPRCTPAKIRRHLSDHSSEHLLSDFTRSAFVKVEVGTGLESRPRLIQDSTAGAYHNVIGPYFLALSKAAARTYGLSGRVLYASGYDPETVGSWFSRNWARYVEIDYSAFDTTVARFILKHLCVWHVKRGPNRPLFARAINAQMWPTGTTRLGRILYKLSSQRCSGDDNTSCDNTLINQALTEFLLDGTSPAESQHAESGDDVLVGCTERVAHTLAARLPLVEALGFKPKVKIVSHYNDAVFLSRRLWSRSFGARPGRFLSKAGWSVIDLTIQEKVRSLVATDIDTPFVGAYVSAVLRLPYRPLTPADDALCVRAF